MQNFAKKQDTAEIMALLNPPPKRPGEGPPGPVETAGLGFTTPTRPLSCVGFPWKISICGPLQNRTKIKLIWTVVEYLVGFSQRKIRCFPV